MFDPAVVEPDRGLPRRARGRRARARARRRDRADRAAAGRAAASQVHGIDLSRAMVRRLRAKPGGEGIEVTIGDFATTRVEGSFRLAYLVCNTIMNLTTQAEQVACFRNAAAHLEPGGQFVVEVGVPDLRRLPPGERFVVFDASETALGRRRVRRREPGPDLASLRDPSTDDVEKSSGPFRYVWPAELDLMAQLGRHGAPRALGGLGQRAVHQRQPAARLGLGEAASVRRESPGGTARATSASSRRVDLRVRQRLARVAGPSALRGTGHGRAQGARSARWP